MKKIYLDEVEEKGSDLMNFSRIEISQKIEELRLAPNNFIWQGRAHASFMESYNKKIDTVTKLNDNFVKIAEYLLQVKDDYHNTNQQIDNAYNELLSDFEKVKKMDDFV